MKKRLLASFMILSLVFSQVLTLVSASEEYNYKNEESVADLK